MGVSQVSGVKRVAIPSGCFDEKTTENENGDTSIALFEGAEMKDLFRELVRDALYELMECEVKAFTGAGLSGGLWKLEARSRTSDARVRKTGTCQSLIRGTRRDSHPSRVTPAPPHEETVTQVGHPADLVCPIDERPPIGVLIQNRKLD